MATTSNVRDQNKASVLRSLFRRGMATRAQLGDDGSMSPATVGRVIEDLLKESLLELDEPANEGAIGRPLKNVRLDRTVPRFVLVEIGPRFTRLAAVPADFRSVTEWQSEHATPTSAKAWQEWLPAAYAALKLRSKPDTVVLSVPGIVDERGGRALLSPNLHWVVGFDFEASVNAVVSAPVRLVQEVRALARGFIANSATPSSFLLVDFGTGLGATPVVNGQLYKGALPLVGEIGHTPVEGQSRPCNCGGKGCLETIMGRAHVLGQADTDDFRKFSADIERDGIPDWFAERLDATGHIIGGALNTLGLNNVVLTGYFAELPIEAVDRLSDAIRQSSLWARFGRIHVQRAPRQRLSGLASACFDRMMEGLLS